MSSPGAGCSPGSPAAKGLTTVSLMLDERPAGARTAPDPAPTAQHVVLRVDQARPRRGLRLGTIVALAVIGLVAFVGVATWRGWMGLGGLFGSRTIDRSAPVLVEKLRDRAEYRGASGTFSATVDLEHRPVSIVPTFLAGDRVIYNGVGDVDATVSLKHLTRSAVRVQGDTLVVRLPHARLNPARLDPVHSHVMNRDRGLADRLGGIFVDEPTSERTVEAVAQSRIERAAAKSDLVAKAEKNTATMITGLARALGVDRVRVRFGAA
jgi:hypothetical protein